MKLNAIKRDNAIEVQLNGTDKIYILNKEILREELTWCLSIDHKNLVLNLSGIRFIDTSGFKLLIELNQLYRNLGKTLELSNVTAEVEELFELVKVNQLFGREITKEQIKFKQPLLYNS